jgi:hypothetical protein
MATQIFREGMTPPVDDDMGSMQKFLKKDKGSKTKSFDDIPPLPNAKYKTADEAKKEMNKAQQDWNKSERKLPSGTLGDNMRNMKKGGTVKKYADGGMTQQPTYPFYGNQPQAGGQNGGTNQTFNMQPQANAAPNQQPMQQPMQTFKKGGKVSSASSRADGCAIRGKTRA